jgi:hypothetical protein
MPRPRFETKVDSFVAEGATPIQSHGGVLLRSREHPGLYIALVKPNGVLTNAGEYYQEHHGELQTRGLDLSQVPQRDGNTEYVTIRGKRRATRVWNGMEFKFTKLG